MSDAVVAALVAGVVSVLVTFGKVLWDARQKRQERQLAAREKLDRYRAPLLAAVDDLGSRVNNIRHDGFLNYLGTEDRGRAALLSTLFRFAQFFGWVELLYGYSDRLRFESDESTKAVADILKTIARTLAVDRLDRADPADFTTTRLMIWREEQRAVGEIMRAADDAPGVVSYDTFVRDFESRFAVWFRTFASQLDPERTPGSARLADLQRLLADLARSLDIDAAVVTVDADGVVAEPRWARPSMLLGDRQAGGVAT